VLTNPKRYDVPVTIIACEFPSATIRDWIEQGLPFIAELAKIKSVELVDLPTGHWPQFTKPAELADAIRKAVEG
jgi:pimeloyl-ACP methyl ester carboxylesterase